MKQTLALLNLLIWAFPAVLPAGFVLAADAARPLVSSDTFLAIDESAFESIETMSLSLCEARKHPSNPILKNRPGGPDAWRAGFPWVLLDAGRFRMWYLARDAAGEFSTCYAESSDGYHWTYPELGIIERHGSRANNVCYKGHTLFPTIFRDDQAVDPARRYIGVIFGQITGAHFNEAQRKRYGGSQPSIKCLAYSPDGLHWQEDHSALFPIRAKVEGGTLFRVGQRWFMAHQQNTGEYPEVNRWSRFVSISSSDDLKNWKLGDAPGFFFDPRFQGIIQTHVTPGYQHYGNVTVAAQGLFYDNAELLDHETDLTLILTNNGHAWRQPKPRQPLSYLLRRGDRDSWDRSFVVQGNLLSIGSKTLLYYNGSQWGNADADGIQIGVAELRLDGYGSLAPQIGWAFGKEGPFEGQLVSRPIALQEAGLRLYLNLQAGEDRRDIVKAALCDASGAVLSGFGFDDCDNLNVSSVGLPVRWRGGADLTALAGKSVKVKIRITAYNPQRSAKVRAQEPQLYAFYFDKPTLHLNTQQAAFASGLERQHLSDAHYPSLPGIDVASADPVSVRMTALRPDLAELAFAGSGRVSVSGNAIQSTEFEGKSIAPKDGVFSFDVTRAGVLKARLSK